MGQTYVELGNFTRAMTYCKKGLTLAEELEQLPNQKEACNCLYLTYKASGNGSKALEYHEQMLVLNDSLQSEETAKKLQQMEFAKQVMADSLLQVEKDLQVEMAHQEQVRRKDKNRNLALGAGIFFFGPLRRIFQPMALCQKVKGRYREGKRPFGQPAAQHLAV